MAISKLTQLAAKAVENANPDKLTFKLADLESVVTRNQKVSFRVTLSNGTTVTFWSTNMAELVTELPDGLTCQLLPGVEILENGNLIPGGSQWEGPWAGK